MPTEALKERRLAAAPRKHPKSVARPTRKLSIHDLGWSRERAREVRAKLATFATDWDDPSMDVYNEP